MLTITRCRKILGKAAEKMTDTEIEELRNVFIVISDIAIDSYLAKKKININQYKYEHAISKS